MTATKSRMQDRIGISRQASICSAEGVDAILKDKPQKGILPASQDKVMYIFGVGALDVEVHTIVARSIIAGWIPDIGLLM